MVIMTGHGDVTLAVEAMKAGAVDFIEKPFEKAVLIGAIEEAFGMIDRSRVAGERARDAKVRLQALTGRERDVLDGLVKGLPNKTIGNPAFGISATHGRDLDGVLARNRALLVVRIHQLVVAVLIGAAERRAA